MARVKRSPKRMANCAFAMQHSRAGMVHSFSDRFKTKNRAVANDVGIDCCAFAGGERVSAQAARSMGGSVGFSVSVGQPSTFLMVIWPEASSAQKSMAAVSAEGSTVWVLIRRLNSSCSRSTAFVVRADFHWLGGGLLQAVGHGPALQPPQAA